MDLIRCTEKDMQELYDGDAWTWEGMTTDDDNLKDIIDWFAEEGCPLRKEEFYITTGAQMNKFCGGLTGDNAYKDDLTILSIKLENITKFQNLVLKKFLVGARWYSDIVDNNRNK